MTGMKRLTERETRMTEERVADLHVELAHYRGKLDVEQAKRKAANLPFQCGSMEGHYITKVHEAEQEIEYHVDILARFGHQSA
jgi:hypothetical protein